jgi:asparagine synthase (glutamine-hydrolysing)
MCGISGAFALDGTLPPDTANRVRRMTDALAHRGPDGDGFFNDRFASLGHRRLAIIDVAGGHQPMPNEDETCWIVFNGEVYNHRDLRPILEAKGHRFRTHCDTEVILHAYEEYGPACVERLEGMFAFAIYDGRRRELFAARDRVGKKPFFYTVADGVFSFASELPALRQSHAWRGELDPSGLETYLSLGYFIAPRTVYKDVFKLPPASWLRIANGHVQIQTYWDVVEFDTDQRPTEQLLDEIDSTLRVAVRDRLESEVPLGAFLSGGIDSGLVVSYMAEELKGRLVTTSVGFGDPEHNELEAAALVARHFESSHHPEIIQPELDEVMGPIVDALGEPMADSSAIPTWYVSRAARKHVTVALTGDGGDETFAGYDFRYLPHARDSRLRRRLPSLAIAGAGQLGRHWPQTPIPGADRLGRALTNLSLDDDAAYFADLQFMKAQDTAALLGKDPARSDGGWTYATVTDAYRRCSSSDPVQRAEYADLKIYLPNDPLVKVDRMSMAHSLEVRSPLLDRRLIELAFRIPVRQKVMASRGKALLRNLAKQRLPSNLWRLPKKGFTVPIGGWIAGPARRSFEDQLFGPGAHLTTALDWTEVRSRFEQHLAGAFDYSYDLWAIWNLERWLRAAGLQSEKIRPSMSPALEHGAVPNKGLRGPWRV